MKEVELINEYKSPVYVYDYDIINDRCNKLYAFKKKLEIKLNRRVTMHYSPKANSNPSILKIVKENNLGVDSMSPLELSIVKKCGFNNEEILYVCNNIDQEEMKLVHDNNILICLDSISQVETWGKLFPQTNIMVRINPGTIGVGHSNKVITSGKDTKFGISEDNLNNLFDVVKRYSLNIIGVHQHLGSLFLDDKIDNYILGVQAGLKIIKKYFKNLEVVDLGGGFGVPYKPNEKKLNLDKVEEKLENILLDFIKEYPSVKEFKFEPGRYIPCESGKIIGKVTSTKYENDKWWIGTDIGMNELVRPSMYDSYHEIYFITDNKKEVQANICGNVCESGDLLAKNRMVILPNVGDIVVVKNAGAYGYSMASNYTGRVRPAEVLIKDNKDILIRKRETIDYLCENIIWKEDL